MDQVSLSKQQGLLYYCIRLDGVVWDWMLQGQKSRTSASRSSEVQSNGGGIQCNGPTDVDAMGEGARWEESRIRWESSEWQWDWNWGRRSVWNQDRRKYSRGQVMNRPSINGKLLLLGWYRKKDGSKRPCLPGYPTLPYLLYLTSSMTISHSGTYPQALFSLP